MNRKLLYGPRALPDVTEVERQWTTVVSFVTDRDAVRWMVPDHFEIPDRPTVSFMHQQLHHVDYMRGRGYNLLNVAVAARYSSADGPVDAPFPIVIWENDTMPIIAGRELHGNPKIFGDVSDLSIGPDDRRFEVREYGTVLVRGEVTSLRPVDADRLTKINAGSAQSLIFGWKLIPDATGNAELDYPTLIRGGSSFDRAWRGVGALHVERPDADSSPYSSEVVAALAELPRLEMKSAFVGEGTATLYRNRTVRLFPPHKRDATMSAVARW